MATATSPTILFVDDDENERRDLANAFRQEGFQVREAASGAEAMLLVVEHPDLVILDVHDQGVQNQELCRAVKAHAAATSIPVLHMASTNGTAHGPTAACPARSQDAMVNTVVAQVRTLLNQQQLEEETFTTASPGGLVRRAAHDCNNLLQAITGNVDLLLKNMPESDSNREVLAAMGRAAWRAAELMQCLLGYSRTSASEPRQFDCGQAIRDTVTLLHPLLDESIAIKVDVAADLWTVDADASQLSRILMNLCLNARDAMPRGGVLTLVAKNVCLLEPVPGPSLGARSGEFVRLSIVDSGHGVPREALPHIFDPFFTTKEKGRGNGLGLAVVREFVELHRGWIDCASEPDHGAQFDIYLPRAGAVS